MPKSIRLYNLVASVLLSLVAGISVWQGNTALVTLASDDGLEGVCCAINNKASILTGKCMGRTTQNVCISYKNNDANITHVDFVSDPWWSWFFSDKTCENSCKYACCDNTNGKCFPKTSENCKSPFVFHNEKYCADNNITNIISLYPEPERLPKGEVECKNPPKEEGICCTGNEEYPFCSVTKREECDPDKFTEEKTCAGEECTKAECESANCPVANNTVVCCSATEQCKTREGTECLEGESFIMNDECSGTDDPRCKKQLCCNSDGTGECTNKISVVCLDGDGIPIEGEVCNAGQNFRCNKQLCCNKDGTGKCTNEISHKCELDGGTPISGVACVADNHSLCEKQLCCNKDGTGKCTNEIPSKCTLSGVPISGEKCAGNNNALCEMKACCTGNTCSNEISSECTEGGGTPVEGDACVGETDPRCQAQACCKKSELNGVTISSCIDLPSYECEEEGGKPSGGGTIGEKGENICTAENDPVCLRQACCEVSDISDNTIECTDGVTPDICRGRGGSPMGIQYSCRDILQAGGTVKDWCKKHLDKGACCDKKTQECKISIDGTCDDGETIYPDNSCQAPASFKCPKPTGCCDSGACFNILPDKCEAPRTLLRDDTGSTVQCGSNSCPQLQGCCDDGYIGGCDDLFPDECRKKGGTPVVDNAGKAVLCGPNSCPRQGCCDGVSCSDEYPNVCRMRGGKPLVDDAGKAVLCFGSNSCPKQGCCLKVYGVIGGQYACTDRAPGECGDAGTPQFINNVPASCEAIGYDCNRINPSITCQPKAVEKNCCNWKSDDETPDGQIVPDKFTDCYDLDCPTPETQCPQNSDECEDKSNVTDTAEDGSPIVPDTDMAGCNYYIPETVKSSHAAEYNLHARQHCSKLLMGIIPPPNSFPSEIILGEGDQSYTIQLEVFKHCTPDVWKSLLDNEFECDSDKGCGTPPSWSDPEHCTEPGCAVPTQDKRKPVVRFGKPWNLPVNNVEVAVKGKTYIHLWGACVKKRPCYMCGDKAALPDAPEEDQNEPANAVILKTP